MSMKILRYMVIRACAQGVEETLLEILKTKIMASAIRIGAASTCLVVSYQAVIISNQYERSREI